jgi:hypothetical protein
MRKIAISILTLAMLGSPAVVFAAGKLKPGLWEMSMKSDAMKNMPKIPPAQMEQMKKMGVPVPQADGVIKHKVCISKEMAEREDPYMERQESGCQMKNHQKTGNSYVVDMVCDGPNLKGTGKVKGTYASNESFNSSYSFKGTAHGQPVDHNSESNGKWLGADCGTVKPMDSVAKKK